jgi:hypothetical protein
MSKHTQGKLKQRTGYPLDITRPDEHYAFARAYRVTTLDNAEANARRLVAAWNACDGIETETLEAHGLASATTKLMKAKAQRDELLSLLSDVSACFTRDDDLPDNLLPRIDAAIKKAEGT